MKNFVKPLSLAVSLGIVSALVIALFQGGSVRAAAPDREREDRNVRVVLPTHLGVPAADLITLSCLPSDTPAPPHCVSFREVSSAGVMATTDYTIPAGKTLVILDIDWEATFGTPGATSFLNFSCTSGCAFIYGSSAINDINGIAHGQDHLSAGLYLTYIPKVSLGGLTSHLSEVQLHGYLTE